MSYGHKTTLALLKSRLLKEADLEKMHKQCYSQEGRAALLMKNVALWNDFCYVEMARRRADENYIQLSEGAFLPFISIRWAKYLLPQLYCSYYQVFNRGLKENNRELLDKLRDSLFRQERETLIAISGELYRCRRGRYPREVSELFPDLLPVLPVDPFTGKPLEYRFK